MKIFEKIIKSMKLFEKYLFLGFILGIFAIPAISFAQPVYSPELDSAFKLLEKNDVKNAIPLFEAHKTMYPGDTRVWLQLAYIYDEQGQYSKSYQYFNYVAKNSKDAIEKEQAEGSAIVMKDKLNSSSKRSIDVNINSFYDTYQKNYITGLNIYYKFKINKDVYVGPYLEVYTDSKSAPGLIYNDRYLELGLFGRFYAIPQLYFEIRSGYVRQFDIDSSKLNVSPRMAFGWRFGSGPEYVTAKTKKKANFFLDFFTMLSYETKYQNGFSQSSLNEVFRYNIKGFSYVDLYLMQNLTLDSRRLDYNNNVNVGGGLRYKPNLEYFPYFYVQPSYKYYLIKDPVTGVKKTGSFQINAGIGFSFSIKG